MLKRMGQGSTRFIGYGAKSDLWYTDDEMMEWAPGLVAEYEAEEEIRLRKIRGKLRARKGAKAKKNQSQAEKRSVMSHVTQIYF
jgi:hypothetical protein